jgi:hypothetical protein
MTDWTEDDRKRELHRIERHVAAQPGTGKDRPDQIHVIKWPGPDGADFYAMCRWSLAKRPIRDAAELGDTVEDLGPDALMLCQAAQRGEFGKGELLKVGVAKDGHWIAWLIPTAPVEPVPGSPEQKHQQS